MTYLARRLLHGFALLLAVSFLSYLLAQLAPGDFYSTLASDPRVSASTLAALRSQSGAGHSFLARYASWLASALRGDFGYSLAYAEPVSSLLRSRFASTLLLTATSALLSWILALPIGIWSATHRRTVRDRALRLTLASFLAAPDLLLAIAFLLLAVQTGWFPTGGMFSRGHDALSASARFRDVAWHLALPAVVLTAGLAPALVRHVRAAMLDAIDAPFALAARAQGILRRRLLYRHILPVAANPLISLAGFSIGTLLSASLIVEVVMGWPGLGPLFLDAVVARDLPIVLAVTVISTAVLLAGNLLADLLLYRADPRIRTVDL